MPPSGYSRKQSKLIINFLKSVSNSLIKEGKDFELTPCVALKKEIDNIDVILKSDNIDKVSDPVLEITKWFYEEMLKLKPNSYKEFIKNRKVVLPKAKSIILKIHVPELG